MACPGFDEARKAALIATEAIHDCLNECAPDVPPQLARLSEMASFAAQLQEIQTELEHSSCYLRGALTKEARESKLHTTLRASGVIHNP